MNANAAPLRPRAAPDFALRPVADADMAAIQAIYAHHVLNGFASFEEVPPDLAEMRRRRDDILAKGLPYIVAESGGRVLGYAYAGPYRTRSAYRFSLEDSIYVAPDLGRRGIGRALLTELVDRAAAGGYRQMVAVIGDTDNAPSIKLHEACGFTVVGTFAAIGWKRGRWVDSVLMQRPLGPGASRGPDR
jgi:L-amino acid N-acyltransferase YncA